MNYANNQPVKLGDKVKGKDHAGRDVTGTVVKGDPKLGHPDEFVFKHGGHGGLCPSLHLENFLPQTETAGAGGTLIAADTKAAP